MLTFKNIIKVHIWTFDIHHMPFILVQNEFASKWSIKHHTYFCGYTLIWLIHKLNSHSWIQYGKQNYPWMPKLIILEKGNLLFWLVVITISLGMMKALIAKKKRLEKPIIGINKLCSCAPLFRWWPPELFVY
jgi:hypothetical protein